MPVEKDLFLRITFLQNYQNLPSFAVGRSVIALVEKITVQFRLVYFSLSSVPKPTSKVTTTFRFQYVTVTLQVTNVSAKHGIAAVNAYSGE